MHRLLVICFLACTVTLWGQSSSSSPAPAASQKNSPTPNADSSHKTQAVNPRLEPPRSDRVDARDLEDGESSSKDTKVDLSPPDDDVKVHPHSADALRDEQGTGAGSGEVAEFHPWDPHKAAKDVEVGDYYFKNKNYKAAESRYREALYYKDNDALATFRLAICLEKLGQPDEAVAEYQSYLKILPDGAEANTASKAIERLSGPAAGKPSK